MNRFPKLALGTWLMGGTKEPDPNNDDARDIQVIKTAIESGVTLIDTAQNYAAGRCEELVRQAVSDLGREEFKILTKQIKSNLTFNEVVEGCHASIKRLGVDYIDYFVCHAPNPDTDMKQFFRACNKLYNEGLIKNVGVSNFGPKMLKIAIDNSETPIRLNQLSFSIGDYDIISSGTYDFCLDNNIPIQAYRTLVGINDNRDLVDKLQPMAAKYNINIEQLSIAYLNSYENINFTIRASTVEHWAEIKSALKVKLSTKDHNNIKSLHKNRSGHFSHFLLV